MNVEKYLTECLSIDENYRKLPVFENEVQAGGDNFKDIVCSYMKKRFRFNLCKWETDNKYYPQYMFLSGDKGILAYVVINYYSGKFFRDEYLRLPINDVIKMVSYSESRLDRPIFFLKFLNFENRKGLFFETSDQMKARIFNEIESTDENCYIPDISVMGDFRNLKEIWDDLKKNSVRRLHKPKEVL